MTYCEERHSIKHDIGYRGNHESVVMQCLEQVAVQKAVESPLRAASGALETCQEMEQAFGMEFPVGRVGHGIEHKDRGHRDGRSHD